MIIRRCMRNTLGNERIYTIYLALGLHATKNDLTGRSFFLGCRIGQRQMYVFSRRRVFYFNDAAGYICSPSGLRRRGP